MLNFNQLELLQLIKTLSMSVLFKWVLLFILISSKRYKLIIEIKCEVLIQ